MNIEVPFNAPSIASLKRMDWVSKARNPDEVARKMRECMKKPLRLDPLRNDYSPIKQRMEELDGIAGTCGVFLLRSKRANYFLINTGDAYAETILANPEGHSFYIGMWGSIAEKNRDANLIGF